MGTCCAKREGTKGLETPGKNAKVSAKEIDDSLGYINRFFNENKGSDTLFLFYSKDQVTNFITSLSKILTIIKNKTEGKLFLPISIQSSPLDPQNEFMVILRSVDHISKYNIKDFKDPQKPAEFLSETAIAQQFTVRNFQFA